MDKKAEFVITIAGLPNTGKTAVAHIIEAALLAEGIFDVKVADDLQPVFYNDKVLRRERINALQEKHPAVLIKPEQVDYKRNGWLIESAYIQPLCHIYQQAASAPGTLLTSMEVAKKSEERTSGATDDEFPVLVLPQVPTAPVPSYRSAFPGVEMRALYVERAYNEILKIDADEAQRFFDQYGPGGPVADGSAAPDEKDEDHHNNAHTD